MNAVLGRDAFNAFAGGYYRDAVGECLEDFDFHAAASLGSIKQQTAVLEERPRVGHVFQNLDSRHRQKRPQRGSRMPADDDYSDLRQLSSNGGQEPSQQPHRGRVGGIPIHGANEADVRLPRPAFRGNERILFRI